MGVFAVAFAQGDEDSGQSAGDLIVPELVLFLQGSDGRHVFLAGHDDTFIS